MSNKKSGSQVASDLADHTPKKPPITQKTDPKDTAHTPPITDHIAS